MIKDKIQAAFYYLCLPAVLFRARFLFLFGRRQALQQYLHRVNSLFLPFLMRKFGASVGNGVVFNGPLWFDNLPGKKKPLDSVTIENRCFIGTDVFFDLPDKIIIKEQAVVSAGVKILTHNDVGNRPLKKKYPRKQAPVTLEEGCWIGVNAVILAGVTVGKKAVVAAGAVVTRDVEPETAVGGIPARPLQKKTL